MDPALAIGLVVVIAGFLGWWLWAARRRQRTGGTGGQPRDAWDALNRGIDPSEADDLDGVADGGTAEPEDDAEPR